MNSIALPFRLKLAFGVGQSATGAMNISLALFLLFYYNQVLGLSGTLAGLAVGVSVLLDCRIRSSVRFRTIGVRASGGAIRSCTHRFCRWTSCSTRWWIPRSACSSG